MRRPGRTNDALNTIVVDEEATKIKARLKQNCLQPLEHQVSVVVWRTIKFQHKEH